MDAKAIENQEITTLTRFASYHLYLNIASRADFLLEASLPSGCQSGKCTCDDNKIYHITRIDTEK